MPAVRSSRDIAEKWSRVTPQRSTDYQAGVQAPRKDWEASAAAARETWQAGIQQAAAEDRFSRGVRQAGSRKWTEKTLQKGPSRWSQGVQISAPDYEKGFGPFRDVIERTEIPPRGPKGDPRNIERVAVIARALNEAKRRM